MKRIVIFIFLVMVVFGFGYKKMNSAFEEQPKEVIIFENEITLLDAYRIGMKKANEFSKKNELIYLNSVNDGRISGGDGKKGNWQGIISLLDSNQRLLFGIEEGKLNAYEVIESSEELTIKDSELKIDSDQIVNYAIDEFKLKPGSKNDSFSNGYHFRVLRDEKNIFIAVSGQLDGKGGEIYYNPRNGEYMGRTESNK